MSVQVDPYQLRFLASRFSAGAQELLLKANRLESIMNDLVQGSWKGEGAHAFAIKCEMMKSDLQKAVEVLNNAVQTLNLFANQMDRVNQLRQQANMLEQQSWQYSGDSIDALHHRQNLARQAAQIRQEAEWEANAADAKAANDFQSIMTMIPQVMAQVGHLLGSKTGTSELDELPEPLRSYYLRHMDLLQDDEGETAVTLTMGSFKQADYEGVAEYEKRHDQLVLQAKEILRRKDVEGYITDPAEMKRIVDSSFQLECGDLNDVELEMYVQQNSEGMQLAEKMQNERHQGIDITKDPEYIAFAMRQGGYEPTGFNPDGVAGMVRGRVFGNGRVAELPSEFSGVRDGYYDSQSEASGNKSNETKNAAETDKESTDHKQAIDESNSNDASVEEIPKVNFSSNLEDHITKVDPNVPRRRGIGGAHNKDEFMKNDVNILNIKNHGSMPGVEKIIYQVPSIDAKTGQITGWRTKPFEKTVYDPKVISDEEFINRGKEAANNAASGGTLGREWEGYDSQGIKWRGYTDENGEVTSFYPEL